MKKNIKLFSKIFVLILISIVFVLPFFVSSNITSLADEKDNIQDFLNFESQLIDMVNQEEANEISKSPSLQSNLETGEDDNEVIEIEAESIYQSKRLIVQGDLNETYGALKHIKYNDLHILSYATVEETKNAFNKLSQNKNLNVLIDKKETLTSYADTDYDYSSYQNWGAEAMDIGGYRQYLTDNNANKEVVVVVMDTGINTSHNMFKDRLLKNESGKIKGFSYDNSSYTYSYSNLAFDEDDTNKFTFEDYNGHGTHVAGIVCSLTPSNVKILPIKISIGDEGNAYTSTILTAYKRIINIYSKQYNIASVNLSFSGAGKESQSSANTYNTQCYQPMLDLGIMPITSAGNEGEENNVEGLKAIVVSAMEKSGNAYFFDRGYSNYGQIIDVSAPGSNIKSAGACTSNSANATRMVTMSGTSMASPQVAGIVALLSLDPKFASGYTATQMEELLYKNTLDYGTPGKDILYGYGAINLKFFEFDSSAENITFYSNGEELNINSEEVTFVDSMEVEAICSDASFQLMYTSNGQLPSPNFHIEYPGKITLTENTTLMFIGLKYNNGKIIDVTPLYCIKFIDENAPIESYFTIDSNGKLLTYTGNFTKLVVPDKVNNITVTSTDLSLFANSKIEHITFPETLTSMAGFVFQNCTSLKYLYAPGLTKVYTRVFSGCTNIITVSGEHPEEGTEEGIFLPALTETVGYAFSNCTNLRSVSLPNLKILGSVLGYDFNFCYRLQTVDLPNLTDIGEYTFDTCELLNVLTLGPNLKNIGNFAFNGARIKALNFSATNCTTGNYYNSSTGILRPPFQNVRIDKLIISSNVAIVPSYLFQSARINTLHIQSIKTKFSANCFKDQTAYVRQIYFDFTNTILSSHSVYKQILQNGSGLMNNNDNNIQYIFSKTYYKFSQHSSFSALTYNTKKGDYYVFSQKSLNNVCMINAYSNEYGYIDKAGIRYLNDGESVTLRFHANFNCFLASLKVNGEEIELDLLSAYLISGYTLYGGIKDYEIQATFALKTMYTVSVTGNEYVQNAFLSQDNNATSGNSSLTIEAGEILYYYAILHDDTDQYVYSLSNFEKKISDTIYLVGSLIVSENKTITIDAIRTLQTYTIRWLNYDGTELDSETFEYGSTPSYSGATPLKPNTEDNGYIFSGWTPAFSAVTGNQDYTATFLTVPLFVIEVNGNEFTQNVFISTSNNATSGNTSLKVAQGSTLYYYGILIEDTPQYRYFFNDYTSQINERIYLIGSLIATENKSIDVLASQVLQQYTITWQNYDGTELDRQVLDYGTMPVYNGTTPIKPDNLEFLYAFDNWTPNVEVVTQNQIYIASFIATPLYAISVRGNEYVQNAFISHENNATNGETIVHVIAGTTLYYYASLLENNAQYSYTLSNFTTKFNNIFYLVGEIVVNEDKELLINAISTLNSYTITWLNEDGALLERQVFDYGETPLYQGQAPTKASSYSYVYQFDSWSPAVEVVVCDQNYTATYIAIPLYSIGVKGNAYTQNVFFSTSNNATSGNDWERVARGTTLYCYANLLTDTIQYHYSIIGYLNKITETIYLMGSFTVSEDREITFNARRNLQTYTISWLNYDGTILNRQILEYGTSPLYEGSAPTKPASSTHIFEFEGWSPVITQVTGNQSYVANFMSYTTYSIKIEGLSYISNVFISYDNNATSGATHLRAPEGKTIYCYAQIFEDTAQYDYVIDSYLEKLDDNLYLVDTFEVGEDKVISVSASRHLISYTITWVDFDGTVLDSQVLEYGQTPVFNGQQPVRESSTKNTFEFNGWSPKIEKVTKNHVYTADYITTTMVEEKHETNTLALVAVGIGGTFFIGTFVAMIWPKKKFD